MYFLDLFSGIGGFALGAYWAGLRFDGHYFSEVDPYAISVYSKRFPDAVPLGDIRAIKGTDLPEGEWIIAGGFPCQDISVAGKGAGLAGERSGLWYEYARLIGELRPRFAIMENVGALAFRGLDSVLGSLAALGYDAEWQDIRASDVGAPHRRERLWIVAYPHKDSKSTCPKYDDKPRMQKVFYSKRRVVSLGWDMAGARRIKKPISQYRFWQETDSPVGMGVDDGLPQRLDRLKCLGNSIVPQIAMLIFRWIKRLLDMEQP